MSQKAGRNDPCPCGSGKKYKQCCLRKTDSTGVSLAGKRKFTAKVISSGGMKPEELPEQDSLFVSAADDYNRLMERSFGDALHDENETLPPRSHDPLTYLPSTNDKES